MNRELKAALRERKVPYSLEAETSVLGAMMLQENALLKGLEGLREEDFYHEAHRKIYRALAHLFESKRSVDILSVKETLQRRGDLEDIGGATYLAQLVQSAISPALMDPHMEILVEKLIFRQV